MGTDVGVQTIMPATHVKGFILYLKKQNEGSQ